MGALPSRESNESPNQIYFMNFGGEVLLNLPLIKRFFPCKESLAFQQLLHCRAHQSSKYNYESNQVPFPENYLSDESDPSFFVSSEGNADTALKKAVMSDEQMYNRLVEFVEKNMLFSTNAELRNAALSSQKNNRGVFPISEVVLKRMDPEEARQTTAEFRKNKIKKKKHFCHLQADVNAQKATKSDKVDEVLLEGFPDFEREPMPFEDLDNEANHKYLDGRVHLVEHEGVLYIFSYNPNYVHEFYNKNGKKMSTQLESFLASISVEHVTELKKEWYSNSFLHEAQFHTARKRDLFDTSTDVANRTFEESLSKNQPTFASARAARRAELLNDEDQRYVYTVLQERYKRYYIPVLPVSVIGMNALLPKSLLARELSSTLSLRLPPNDPLRLVRFMHSQKACERKLNTMFLLSSLLFREKVFLTTFLEGAGTDFNRFFAHIVKSVYVIGKNNDSPLLNLIEEITLRKCVSYFELLEGNKGLVGAASADEVYWNDYTSMVNVPKLGFLKMCSPETIVRLREQSDKENEGAKKFTVEAFKALCRGHPSEEEPAKKRLRYESEEVAENTIKKTGEEEEGHTKTQEKENIVHDIPASSFSVYKDLVASLRTTHRLKHDGVVISPSNYQNDVPQQSPGTTTYGAKCFKLQVEQRYALELLNFLSLSTCPVVITHHLTKFNLVRHNFSAPHYVFDFGGSLLANTLADLSEIVVTEKISAASQEANCIGRVPLYYVSTNTLMTEAQQLELCRKHISVLRQAAAAHPGILPDDVQLNLEHFSPAKAENEQLRDLLFLVIYLEEVRQLVANVTPNEIRKVKLLSYIQNNFSSSAFQFQYALFDGETVALSPLTKSFLPVHIFVGFLQVLTYFWFIHQNEKAQAIELKKKKDFPCLMSFFFSHYEPLFNFAFDPRVSVTSPRHPSYDVFTNEHVRLNPYSNEDGLICMSKTLFELQEMALKFAASLLGKENEFTDLFPPLLYILPQKHELFLHWFNVQGGNVGLEREADKDDKRWLRSRATDGEEVLAVTFDKYFIWCYSFDNNIFYKGDKPRFGRKERTKKKKKSEQQTHENGNKGLLGTANVSARDLNKNVIDVPETAIPNEPKIVNRARGTYRWNPYKNN